MEVCVVAALDVAGSADCAAVVECVGAAVGVGGDVVGFGTVGSLSAAVVEGGVAEWAVGDAVGLVAVEYLGAPAFVLRCASSACCHVMVVGTVDVPLAG